MYEILSLINLASKVNEFVMQAKCYHINKHPALIQILFVYERKLHIILVETVYLT